MLPARDSGCEQCTNAQRECLKPNMPMEMVEMRIIAVVVAVMLMLMLMMTLMMTFLPTLQLHHSDIVPSSSQPVTP